MYYFMTDRKYEELIKSGIDICANLQIPISNNVIFKNCTGDTRFGYCIKDKEYGYRIFINKNIVSDEQIVNTAIHELLHTIPNEGFKPHAGNWKKYAKIISENTKYKMTVTGHPSLIYYSNKKSVSLKTCFCPICGVGYEVPINKIYLDRSTYYCKYHLKYYYIDYPKSPLRDMNDIERENYVTKMLNDELDLDKYVEMLPYTSISTSRKIIKFILQKFDFTLENFKKIDLYIRIDKLLLDDLAKAWCQGLYISKIKSVKDRINFEGLFALTKWWLEVTEYSDKVFGSLSDTNLTN